MSKKDKKIEIQLVEEKQNINGVKVEGYQLLYGKKVIGDIAELDEKFAVLKNGEISVLYKTLEKAVEAIIENFNLNH